MPTAAQGFRQQLRVGLIAARKARQTDTVAALRIALAAIDNAEVVPVDDEAAALKPYL